MADTHSQKCYRGITGQKTQEFLDDLPIFGHKRGNKENDAARTGRYRGLHILPWDELYSHVKLPDVRRNGGDITISVKDLKALVHVLQAYLDSPKTKIPPSKKLLHNAALTLMQEGAVLSHQWDKT